MDQVVVIRSCARSRAGANLESLGKPTLFAIRIHGVDASEHDTEQVEHQVAGVHGCWIENNDAAETPLEWASGSTGQQCELVAMRRRGVVSAPRSRAARG